MGNCMLVIGCFVNRIQKDAVGVGFLSLYSN